MNHAQEGSQNLGVPPNARVTFKTHAASLHNNTQGCASVVPSMSGSASTLCLNKGHVLLWKALIFHTFAFHGAEVKAAELIAICKN